MTGYCYDVQYKRFKDPIPVGKIPDKSRLWESITIWHCILSAELTKTHSCFFGDFAHWVIKLYSY